MDKLDLKILKAINTLSQSFISPIAVSDIIKIDKKDLGDRFDGPGKIRENRHQKQGVYIQHDPS
jgi:hypothetical protein